MHRRARGPTPGAEPAERPPGARRGEHLAPGRYRDRVNTPDDRRPPDPAREAAELTHEAAVARVQDANLARLRQQDQDADRIFPPGPAFTDALLDDDAMRRIGVATEAYGTAKHATGRMDLFHSLFDGTGDNDLPWTPWTT